MPLDPFQEDSGWVWPHEKREATRKEQWKNEDNDLKKEKRNQSKNLCLLNSFLYARAGGHSEIRYGEELERHSSKKGENWINEKAVEFSPVLSRFPST